MIEALHLNKGHIMHGKNDGDARVLAGVNDMLGKIGILPFSSLAEVSAMPTDAESLAAFMEGKSAPGTGTGHAAASATPDADSSTSIAYAAVARYMADFTQEQYRRALHGGEK